MNKFCCLIAACDPKYVHGKRCRHCGGPWRKPKVYVRPPWDRVYVVMNEKGELSVERPGRLPGTESRGGKNGMPDEDFARSYPTITEYLTTTQWADGGPREPSRLSMFVEQGVVKLALYDKDCERSVFVAAESLTQALATLEAELQGVSIRWVVWKNPRAKPKKS